jgi:hypothetical protein
VIADIADFQREVVGEGMLDTEVPIRDVRVAEVRVCRHDVARAGVCRAASQGHAITALNIASVRRKNHAIPGKFGSRDTDGTEVDRAATGCSHSVHNQVGSCRDGSEAGLHVVRGPGVR